MKSEYRAKMCVDALKDLTTEQIEELKVWLKSESTTLMFDYVAKNRLLESENEKLKKALKNLSLMAQTSCGTAGKDEGLMKAIEKASELLK